MPEKNKSELEPKVTRCCICKAIELSDGTKLSGSQYNPRELEEQGYWISDTYLSKQCLIAQCGEEFVREMARNNPEISQLPEVCTKSPKVEKIYTNSGSIRAKFEDLDVDPRGLSELGRLLLLKTKPTSLGKMLLGE